MKRLMFALACCAAFLAGCAGTMPGRPHSGIERSGGDPTVRPQDDLFRRVNGSWLKTAEIPPDKFYIGTWETLQDNVQEQLRGLLENAAKRRDDADARRIADLYASFMDEATVERAGLAPLGAELAAIDAIGTPGELGRAMGRLSRLGVGVPIGMNIDQDNRDATRYVPILSQGGLGLPDRDYYLVADDAKFATARSSYATYLKRLLQLSNASGDVAASADAVIALETALARGQWTRVENRDPVKTYNKIDTSALATLAPAFDWPGWLAATGLAGKASDVIVRQPSYLGALSAQLGATPLPVWKTYLRTRLLHSYAPYLSKDFVDARFAFTGTTLSGATENLPRWKRGVALVETSVGESLGKLYVEAYFPPESKERMEKLVANLLADYRESIEAIDWMGPAPRRRRRPSSRPSRRRSATRSAGSITARSRSDRATSPATSSARASSTTARDLAKLGKPVDRDEWFMTPQTVNAYYNAVAQRDRLSGRDAAAAVLRPGGRRRGQLRRDRRDHRPRDQPRLRRRRAASSTAPATCATGGPRRTASASRRRRKTLVEQYAAFSPIPGYTVNGELTLGENIADNSGLEIAYKAYHRSLAASPRR